MYVINERREKIEIDKTTDITEHFISNGKSYDDFGVAAFIIATIAFFVSIYLWFRVNAIESNCQQMNVETAEMLASVADASQMPSSGSQEESTVSAPSFESSYTSPTSSTTSTPSFEREESTSSFLEEEPSVLPSAGRKSSVAKKGVAKKDVSKKSGSMSKLKKGGKKSAGGKRK